MIREFNNKGVDPIIARDDLSLVTVTPVAVTEDHTLNFFHKDPEKAAQDSNTMPKLVAGGIVGLMILGGGLYAYEYTGHNSAPQQVALKTPVVNRPATEQQASVPQTDTAPEAAPPSVTDTAAPPAPKASRAVKAADNAAPAPARTAAAPATTTDEAINAPMTVTPDTAPAPQAQTAMQQPVIAPNVVTPNVPAPAMANNDAGAPAEPQTPTAQLPADQAEQPAAQ